MHVVVGDPQLDGPLQRFLSQANWADNQILRILQVFLGISGEAVTRMHGTAPKRHPVRFYGCTINQRRGDAICGNRTVLRQDTLDHVLLAAIGEVLDDRVMDSAIEKALERLRAGQENHLDRKTQIERELSLIENRIDRAMDALLDGGPRDELIARLNQEKARKSALTEELSRLSRLVSVVSLDAARIKQDLRQRSAT